MQALWLGQVDYMDAWRLQQELAALRATGCIADVLLLLEHPPTITLGRAASRAHLLASPDELAREGVAVIEVDRGGDITYHGPGQLVGYPILDLTVHRKDLHWYLREVEEALIHVVAEFGVVGRRFPPHTGVWVAERKIAAIGVKVSRWVTQHGFALNVCPDLCHFGWIIPCGIRDFGVTSLSRELRRQVNVSELLAPAAREFCHRFDASPTGIPDDILMEALSKKSREILAPALDSPIGPC
jgi:lipoate-protein ligase B